MKRSVLALIVVLAALVAAIVFWPRPAAVGPEAIAHGRDVCARCRMIIGAPGFAGEIRDAPGSLTRYDDLGCLLAAKREMAAPPRGVWAEDHGGEGLIELGAAHLVSGAGVQTPMGYGIVAFADAAKARELAAAHGAAVVTLAEIERTFTGEPPAAASPGGPEGFFTVNDGRRPLTEADARAAKDLYLRECSACHGDRGRGDGLAAAFSDPRPRDFTKGVFKLRTTESGQPPTTNDILRTIYRGIPGTTMPSFRFLTVEERRRLAAHVLYIADELDAAEPAPIPDPGPAPVASAASIARGKELYATLQCGKCHGDSGKGDGAEQLKDDAGQPVKVRDFTTGVFRGGGDSVDLYHRFVTGMDGSPMPSYGDSIEGGDRWALVDFVQSLRVETKPEPLPASPILAGRRLTEKYGCRACHVLDDGVGGEVGPDLRVSGQKLGFAWVKTFLQAPREYGKIYPWRVHRMPDLGIEAGEAEVLARYLQAMGKRESGELPVPDVASFPEEAVAKGKNFFVLRCTECHNLGKTIEIPEAKRQGPDLSRVANRVDFDWAKRWITNPKTVDPKTRMTVAGITPEEVEAVRMFVWKTALESGAASP